MQSEHGGIVGAGQHCRCPPGALGQQVRINGQGGQGRVA